MVCHCAGIGGRMKDGYQIKCSISSELKGESLIIENRIDGLYEHYYKEIINFKEEAIREALIKLGWTPPKDTSHE